MHKEASMGLEMGWTGRVGWIRPGHLGTLPAWEPWEYSNIEAIRNGPSKTTIPDGASYPPCLISPSLPPMPTGFLLSFGEQTGLNGTMKQKLANSLSLKSRVIWE